MRDVVTQGIVMHLVNVGDAHRLVEFLSVDGVRCHAMARHARASKKRFGGALDAFATLRLHLQGTDEKRTLHSAVVQAQRLGLRTSLDALTQAATLVRCVRILLPQGEACPPMYRILTWSLDMCAEARPIAAAAAYPRLAQAAGILPPLSCGVCARSLGKGAHAPAGVHQGAIMCAGCAPSSRAWPEAVGAALRGAAVTDAAAAQALRQCILDLMSWHTGKPQQAVAL